MQKPGTSNASSLTRPQIFVGSHRKMLQDISESLKHVHLNQPRNGSSGLNSPNGNYDGSNSGGGPNGQGQQGESLRHQQGARNREAFGGHKDKLDSIRDSLFRGMVPNGVDLSLGEAEKRNHPSSSTQYEPETIHGSVPVSQLTRLYQTGGGDSPDSTREGSYASSADSSPIINGGIRPSFTSGHMTRRKPSFDDRTQSSSSTSVDSIPHSGYGHQHQTSRQHIFLGDKTHSLSSSISSNASYGDGRSSVPHHHQQQQQQQQHLPSRFYTTTLIPNDSSMPSSHSSQGVPVQGSIPPTDIRLHTNMAPSYGGRQYIDQRTGNIHLTSGRQPQSSYQNTNHSRVGMSADRTQAVANRLHFGKDGEVTQSYVNKNMDTTGQVSGYTLNGIPAAADGTYITYNKEDGTFKKRTVIITTSTTVTKSGHGVDSGSGHDPPPYPQGGMSYNVAEATRAAQSKPQTPGYSMGHRQSPCYGANYSGQGAPQSSHLTVQHNPIPGNNYNLAGQPHSASNHLTVQPGASQKEQHRSSAHIMIYPQDNQVYSPEIVSAMISKTQPPPSYELSTRQSRTPIPSNAGEGHTCMQRMGGQTMTQQQLNAARMTPQNGHGYYDDASMFKHTHSSVGNMVQPQSQLPQQPVPAIVTFNRIDSHNDPPAASKPPPPYRPAQIHSSKVEVITGNAHLKVPQTAVASSTNIAGNGFQSVRSTTVEKPVLQTAHGPGQPSPTRGPSPDTVSTQSSQSTQSSSTRSESPLIRPPSPISEISDSTEVESASSESQPQEKSRIESPVPERRNKSRHKERYESRVKTYSPEAYKFYMEQHVENILKAHKQRYTRRMQLEAEMQRVELTALDRDQMRRMLIQKESNYLRLKRARMNKSMFKKIKTLGVGAFGEVALARKMDTSALYAVKRLKKLDVLQRNQVGHVKAERDILAEADNEWVVKLYYSFQDKDNLYLVMEYIPGGDLMSLLIRLEIFSEELARFYIAELVLAIESVHKMGFIHRDIKPDNILIDRDGHIKLTDFGLCTGFRWTHDSKYYPRPGHARQDSMDPFDAGDGEKCLCCKDEKLDMKALGQRPLKTLERRRKRQQERCKAHSLVGTPNYIAPEVLQKIGYTQLCDWWSVGVILYEMLVGQPPFHADTPAETQWKVINWQKCLHIPSQAQLTKDASDFILRLCAGSEERLGKNGVLDIKSHPFFQTIDFDSSIRKMKAPYTPTVRHPTDTSNFPESPERVGSNSSTDSWDSNPSEGEPYRQQPDHAFFEFTFRRFFDDNGHPYPMPIDIDRTPGPEGMERSEGDGAACLNSLDLQEMVYV